MSIKYDAYFVSPYGDVIPISTDRHIHEIMAYPEKFGLTTKEIEAIYKKHKEPMGTEGNAREEIMADLIKQGWGRVRYISKNDAFIYQIFILNKRQKENIYDWAKLVIKNGGASKYAGISIFEISPRGGITQGTLDDVVRYKIFEDDVNESRKIRPSKAMVFIEDYIARKK
jgi:hypothetical protein